MSGIRYIKDTNGIVTLLIKLHGSVNKIDGEFISEFTKAITQLEAEREKITGVIITSAKPTFIAGADLKALLTVTRKQAPELLNFVNSFKSLLRRLEKLGRPVVAAINGTVVGGGIEFSLACHHRIAIDAPNIQLGLPEITLGLLPGGGGLVRLIHLWGAEKALTYIFSGKLLTPKAAKKLGLIDDLANDPTDLLYKAQQWILNNPHAQQPYLPGA